MKIVFCRKGLGDNETSGSLSIGFTRCCTMYAESFGFTRCWTVYAESFGQNGNSKTKEITEKVLQELLHHVQLKMKTNLSENKFNRV